MSVHFEPITGGYVRLPIRDTPHRIYLEQAGEGVPLLCLHTAGADSRQFRDLLNDPAVLNQFRVITFDLPWHGKSSPPDGWWRQTYELTAASYIDTVLSIISALQLDRPLVMGCSIGGKAVLYLAAQHAQQVGGIIGLQSGSRVEPYYDIDWLDRPDVHGGRVCAGVVSGLMGPDVPEAARWETLWHYMQGGPGVFKGDLNFYRFDDAGTILGAIDVTTCPVYLLTGEYDYSCTPADTLEVHRAIPGSDATVMDGLGHFPMSEDYGRFRDYLLPVLASAAASREAILGGPQAGGGRASA
jgi:pimeloyl-ACP methyl ester carboxylesterase